MERRIVRAQDLDFDTPGRRDYFVALEHDSIWGDHLIPMTVFVGSQARPGQGLVAFGGGSAMGPLRTHAGGPDRGGGPQTAGTAYSV